MEEVRLGWGRGSETASLCADADVGQAVSHGGWRAAGGQGVI